MGRVLGATVLLGDLHVEDRWTGLGSTLALSSASPVGEPVGPPSLVCPLGPTYCPPNSCMPSRAKTTMNRNSRKRRLMMDFMELSRDTTRFRRELQYLLGQVGSVCTWSHPPRPNPHVDTMLWTLTVTPVASETF